MKYLSEEQIIELNRDLTQGAGTLVDKNGLSSAVGRPMSFAFGKEAYVSISEKAAALIHSLLFNRPFTDENKRTAFAAGLVFLEVNGWSLAADEDTAYKYVMDIIAKDIDDISKMAKFLESSSVTSNQS